MKILFFMSQKPFLFSISSTAQLIQENMMAGSNTPFYSPGPAFYRRQQSSVKAETANPLFCLSSSLGVLDNCE